MNFFDCPIYIQLYIIDEGSFVILIVRTYVFHMLRTYVMILWIGLSFDKMHFTCILVDLGCV